MDDIYDEAITELSLLLREARERADGELDPTTVALATADASGRPSVRTVFVTAIDAAGPVFFARGHSGKAEQLTENPRAAMCFLWYSLRQQVTVEGEVHPLPEADADRYWRHRARDAQLAGWIGEPSLAIAEAEEPGEAIKRLEQHFAGEAVPRPPQWRGLCLHPELLHFWRIDWHRPRTRVRYRRSSDRMWLRERAGPL